MEKIFCKWLKQELKSENSGGISNFHRFAQRLRQLRARERFAQ
jgi:hypothetical protein